MRAIPILILLSQFAPAVQPDRERDKGWFLTVRTAAFSSDGKRVLIAYHQLNVGEHLTIWDVHKGERTNTLGGYESNVMFCQFLKNGSHVISASENGFVYIHRIKGAIAENVRTFRAHRGRFVAALFGKERYLLTFGNRDPEEAPSGNPGYEFTVEMKIWDLESEKLVKTWTTREPAGAHVRISPDGKFRTGGLVWREVDGVAKGKISLWDLSTNKLQKDFPASEGWGGPVFFRGDGNALMLGRSSKKESGALSELVSWDLVANKQTGRWKTPPPGKGRVSSRFFPTQKK